MVAFERIGEAGALGRAAGHQLLQARRRRRAQVLFVHARTRDAHPAAVENRDHPALRNLLPDDHVADGVRLDGAEQHIAQLIRAHHRHADVHVILLIRAAHDVASKLVTRSRVSRSIARWSTAPPVCESTLPPASASMIALHCAIVSWTRNARSAKSSMLPSSSWGEVARTCRTERERCNSPSTALASARAKSTALDLRALLLDRREQRDSRQYSERENAGDREQDQPAAQWYPASHSSFR